MKRHLLNLSAAVLSAAVLLTAGAPFAKESPPPAEKMKKINFPSYKEGSLKNGMQLLVIEHHEQPLATIYLVFKVGSSLDPAGKESLASFTTDQLNKGTTTRSALQLAQWIESVGGTVGSYSASDYSAVIISVLSEYLDTAYQYLQDILTNPTFPEEELAVSRERMKTSLELERSQPSAMAERHFMKAVYGDHPYGKRETVESVTGVTREDLVAFYQKNYVANNMILGVVGDTRWGDVKKAAEKYFGALQPGTPDAATYPEPPKLSSTKVLFYHRPGAVQSEVRIGSTAMKADHPDWPAVAVGNRILGDGSDGRLFMNLREDKGWTYGAYSDFSRMKDFGYFEARAAVRTEVTDSAVTEFMKEIDRIKSEPASQEDLDNAKSYLVGNFPLQIETPDQISGKVMEYKMLGLGKKEMETYLDKIAAVTAADAQRAMSEHAAPGGSYVVVVGDALAMYEKLEKIAPAELYDIDGKPLDYAELAIQPADYTYDSSKILPMKASYSMTAQGMPIGELSLTVDRKKAEKDEIFEVSSVITGMVAMNEHSIFRASDLMPISHKRTFDVMGQSMSTDVVYTESKCTGKHKGPQSEEAKDIEVDLIHGVLLDASVDYALASLPLQLNAKYRFPVVDFDAGNLLSVDAEVIEETAIKTAAGDYDTYKIRLKRPDAEAFMYLSKDAPHFLVKQEIPAQSLVIELKQLSQVSKK